MCFPSPSASAAPAAVVAAPPPPPAKDPKAPVIDPNTQNGKDNASASRQGTSVFRNDLSIPTAAPIGAGLSIPTR